MRNPGVPELAAGGRRKIEGGGVYMAAGRDGHISVGKKP